MTCSEFRSFLEPYVDGELGVLETAAAGGHAATCPECGTLLARERRLRAFLRNQARESAPPALRVRILARVRRAARTVQLVRWALAAAAVGAVVLLVLAVSSRPSTPLVERLVETHIAYAGIEGAVEFASVDRVAVEGWVSRRAGLRITVPDYSAAGLRLLGARIVAAGDREAAHLLYEKGHTLLSVFIVPVGDRPLALGGRPMRYRGREYLAGEHRDHRAVSWRASRFVFVLVSALDYDVILECAEQLQAEHERRTA